MDNNYNSSIEKKWQDYWEKNKIYSFDPKSKKKVFSIDMPPPTVSGKMHIGHALSYSQQDFVARFHRMKENVFYPFGTDDNGLPTERLVEKLNNLKSKSISREEFIRLCMKTIKEIRNDFIQDWKDLGISCDYNMFYSTIDDNSRKIVQKSFIELYEKGFVYRDEFPSIWCPECQTGIAQAELEDKEFPSLFSTIKFSVNGKKLLIATTRPELLGACVAVFVNPEDKRYKIIVGKKAKVPLFDYEVPIIEDKSVDLEKGTSVMMVCSWGDKRDAEAIKKHKLIPRIIFNKNGTLNFGEYNGLKIKEARKRILQDLKEKNLVTEQKSIVHNVNVHDKCGTEIEFLPVKQWFIKILENKKKFIQQGRKIKWHPEFMKKRYENWVNGLEWDWSISRDRHFGVPIPVWICECGNIILADEREIPVDPLNVEKKCKKCGKKAKGEHLVFDTWMTSSLTPQIAGSLCDGIKIPYSMRPSAHDLIRSWNFYTIVKSLYHENNIPWKDIMISGFVTLSGEKMSKSKGNVIEPKAVIDKYGADALRFWAASSKLGEDLDYKENDLIAGKKFIVKLENASKFCFMHLEDFDFKDVKLEIIDKWLLYKLNNIVEISTKNFEKYDYSRTKSEVENFFWNVFCDYYLEIVKDRLYNKERRGDLQRKSAQYTLYNSLLTILKLMAPIMPYITEEVYQNYFVKHENIKSIHVSDWPKFSKKKDDKLEEIGNNVLEIIAEVRKFKAKSNKSMKEPVILTVDKKKFKDVLDDLKAVVSASEIREGEFKVELLNSTKAI